MGYEEFEDGPAHAAEVTDHLNGVMAQTVMVFDSAGDRNSQVLSPTAGMACTQFAEGTDCFYRNDGWTFEHRSRYTVSLISFTGSTSFSTSPAMKADTWYRFTMRLRGGAAGGFKIYMLGPSGASMTTVPTEGFNGTPDVVGNYSATPAGGQAFQLGNDGNSYSNVGANVDQFHEGLVYSGNGGTLGVYLSLEVSPPPVGPNTLSGWVFMEAL